MKEQEYFENICCEVEKTNERAYIPMSPDIVQTSSFYYENYEDFMAASDDEKNHYVYTRGTNPTTENLEQKLARLEGGEKCKVFASGMGAIAATFFTLLKQGNHVLMANTIYGEAVALVRYMEKFGVTVDRVDVSETAELKSFITPATKMIYFESPSSQKFELLDLAEITALAKENNIYTVIDGTWAGPLLQKPLAYDIDLVILSLSKYIGGHSDIVGGAVIGSNQLVDDIFEHGHQSLGAVSSPFNSWLAIRGLRTLPVRMSHLSNAITTLLDELVKDPRIAKIYHPHCGSDQQKQLAKKYLSGYGSLFAIDLVDLDFEKLKIFVNHLNIMSIGVSWGGFESLVLPAYKGNNEQQLKDRGLPISHIRMYLGLEDPQSILEDIKQALDIAYGPLS
ncbi:trans-sulfuration enzyme family protein [Enterococcus sp. HY326]|uniref:trans-sulfuration enzyme family protein n=1 Tax=Enterococcus sp. HY326 TaxID=2971265 RepID=UPI00224061DC|nr:aminotransferase class I/II-fold pyridoxal phosphate-dependent enzyme [Enterococcus sp. HY326]